MKETFLAEPQEVPHVSCDHCGKLTDSQAYSLLLARRRLEREWVFCSLEHLREWAAPIR